MTTQEIKEMMHSLDSVPVPTEMVVTGNAWAVKVLRMEMDILYGRLNAFIDNSPTKDVYSLMKLEYYRNNLSKYKTSENVA